MRSLILRDPDRTPRYLMMKPNYESWNPPTLLRLDSQEPEVVLSRYLANKLKIRKCNKMCSNDERMSKMSERGGHDAPSDEMPQVTRT